MTELQRITAAAQSAAEKWYESDVLHGRGGTATGHYANLSDVLRELKDAVDASPLPPAIDDDSLTVAYMQGCADTRDKLRALPPAEAMADHTLPDILRSLKTWHGELMRSTSEAAKQEGIGEMYNAALSSLTNFGTVDPSLRSMNEAMAGLLDEVIKSWETWGACVEFMGEMQLITRKIYALKRRLPLQAGESKTDDRLWNDRIAEAAILWHTIYSNTDDGDAECDARYKLIGLLRQDAERRARQ